MPAGGCPYVGAGGYFTGGGLGIPGRYLGLHCDSVVGLEAVLANGSVVHAEKGAARARAVAGVVQAPARECSCGRVRSQRHCPTACPGLPGAPNPSRLA